VLVLHKCQLALALPVVYSTFLQQQHAAAAAATAALLLPDVSQLLRTVLIISSVKTRFGPPHAFKQPLVWHTHYLLVVLAIQHVLAGTAAQQHLTSGDPAYQATDATGQSIGPVLPVVGAVGPQIKQAAAAAQDYVTNAIAGEQFGCGW
jgi:hypothetical protein